MTRKNVTEEQKKQKTKNENNTYQRGHFGTYARCATLREKERKNTGHIVHVMRWSDDEGTRGGGGLSP